MRAALRSAWASRGARERVALIALAAIVGVAAYAWLLHSAGRGREQLRASVAILHTQGALLERQAAEHDRLRAAPAAPASQTDLRALVRARVDAARLSGALTRLDAVDADRVQVAFGALPFAEWLAWLAALEVQHVQVEAARIEALSAPGMVSASATLVRAGAQ